MIRKSVLCATLLVVGLCSLSDSVIAQDLEDEFRGVEATQQRDLMTEDATTLAAAEDVSSPVRSRFGLNGDISETGSYIVEIALGALLLFSLIFHIIGRSSNRKIMESWLNRYDRYFNDQFEACGAPDTAHAPPGQREKSFQESPNEYVYYATGRDNAVSMHVKFNLRHRQDLLMYLFDTVVYPVDDKVTVEIVLADDRKCDPALFAVLNKTKVVSFRDEHSSLKEFMVATQHPALSGGLVLLAENAEAAKELIPDSVLEVIAAHEEYFDSLYVTDLNNKVPQGYTANRRNVAYCTFKIPSDPALVAPLFEMLLPLVDHLSAVKLSVIAKGRVDKNRKLLKEQLEKLEQEKAKEALEQKKIEKLEKEKQLYDTLSSQEKAKRDEKEEKKRKKEEDKKKFKKKTI